MTFDDVGQAVLVEGEKILLQGSRGNTIRFTTPAGQTGILTAALRRDDYFGWLIDGVSEEEYFEFLPYAG